jgi:hypothetical protein
MEYFSTAAFFKNQLSEIGPSGIDSPTRITKIPTTAAIIRPASKLNGTFAIAPTT